MKINPKFLSIPPYISTPWENVASLQSVMKEEGLVLIVTLKTGTQIEVPGLDGQTIETIFDAHTKAIQEDAPKAFPIPFSFSLPLNSSEGPINSLGDAMQHNPAQKDLPDLSPNVLEKITAIAKAFGLDDASTLPAPEEGCNCVYCQLTRSFAGNQGEDELVNLEELTFQDWQIEQVEGQLYKVTHPLDANEHYSVFLGTPIGCTCGSKNCEHIKAVLHSSV